MLQDWLEQYATQYGIPLDIARNLVGAESAWKQSAVSPKGAIGLTQLMPATARGLGVDPYDPEQNLRGGMQYLGQQYKEFGSWPLAVAAYNAGPGRVRQYGGVPPFAETQAYVNKVMGGTQPQAPLQLAQAGTPDIQQGILAEIPTMGGQMAPQGPEQQQAPGFFNRLNAAMQSPLFLSGMGILANNQGHYGAAAPAIGRGMMAGQAAAAGMQQDAGEAQRQQLEQQFKLMQMQQMMQKQAREEQAYARVEQMLRMLPPEQRIWAEMNPDAFAKAAIDQMYGGKEAQYGVAPNYERDKEGNVYVTRYASDGTKIREKMDNMPFAVESRTPEYIAQQAAARETATQTAKADVDFGQKYGSDMSLMDETKADIERIARMPGLGKAVGWQSAFPTAPGTEAANYEVGLKQLLGKNFLAAIPNMRGLGALSNAEGDAIRQATSELDLKQSDEQHKRSLAKLYANILKGQERLRTRKFLGAGSEQPAARDEEINAAYQQLFGGGGWKIERVQ